MKNTTLSIFLLISLASCKKGTNNTPPASPGPLLTNIKNYYTGPVNHIDTFYAIISYDNKSRPEKYDYYFNKDLINSTLIRYSGNTMISTMPVGVTGEYLDSIVNNNLQRPVRHITRAAKYGNTDFFYYIKNMLYSYNADGTIKQITTTFYDSTGNTGAGIIRSKLVRDTTIEYYLWDNRNLKTINQVTVQYSVFRENGVITNKYNTQLNKKEEFQYNNQYPVPAKFNNSFLYSYLWWTASMFDPVLSTKIPDKSMVSSTFRNPQGQVINNATEYLNCKILYNKLGLITKIEYDIDPVNKWVYEYTYH